WPHHISGGSTMSSLTRRKFLQTTAAATVAAATTVPSLADAGDPKPDPFGGFRVGLQSYSLRHFKQLDQVLPRIRDLGLHYVEFYNAHVPLNSTEAQIKAVRNLCREHQITPI